MNLAVAENISPMLTQYLEYKAKYPDALLLFQVGDFYELFFDDAVTVSRSLNLTLTSRDKNSPDPVPMAGVPIASVETYVTRLIALGFSVAIVSQSSKPIKGRAAVERKLERIVTPGVQVLCAEGDARQRLLATVVFDPQGSSQSEVGVAYCDVNNGEVWTREGLNQVSLTAELAKISPAEVILPKSINGSTIDRRLALVRELERALGNQTIKFRGESYLQTDTGARKSSEIEGFLALSPLLRKTARLLINYVDEVTVGRTLGIRKISPQARQQSLGIDAVTRRTLELTENSRDGSARGTLFSYLDCTRSVGGARLLRSWLLNPLVNKSEIEARQDLVKIFLEAVNLRGRLAEALKSVCDIERVVTRLELGVVSPRELAALRESLDSAQLIAQQLSGEVNAQIGERLSALIASLTTIKAARENLNILAQSPPFTLTEGGIIAEGINAELDRLRVIKRDGRGFLNQLESSERIKSGINSLKIKYNGVLGYFFEVTQSNLSKIPSYFIRRQSTANCERFTTDELRNREAELLNAESRQIELERQLFADFRDAYKLHAPTLRDAAQALAKLDAVLSLAHVAERDGLVCPSILESCALVINEGKHPVVSVVKGAEFIPNSLDLTAKHFAIVSGPNMGGKSTYLRQTGLIVIMAQMGSFVPAKSAEIGIVDQIFSRMGASDDLSEGESTFMVEMREVSNIVAHATERSLVLVDEVGRGTATADGLAIAQAILEWLVSKTHSRSLFATHFHELTELEGQSDRGSDGQRDRHSDGQCENQCGDIQNLSVGAIERAGEVTFTHQIKAGPANKSYGLEVAKLAGLPPGLLVRAKQLLNGMKHVGNTSGASRQLSIFSTAVMEPVTCEPSDYKSLKSLESSLREVNINELSPIQALNYLYELKKQIDIKESGHNPSAASSAVHSAKS